MTQIPKKIRKFNVRMFKGRKYIFVLEPGTTRPVYPVEPLYVGATLYQKQITAHLRRSFTLLLKQIETVTKGPVEYVHENTKRDKLGLVWQEFVYSVCVIYERLQKKIWSLSVCVNFFRTVLLDKPDVLYIREATKDHINELFYGFYV